jgi:glycosyltransferase involved in cell wall biosynthesis
MHQSAQNRSVHTSRIAWIFPSLALGNYWHPVFSQLTQQLPHTQIFTGDWPGFAPGFEDTFAVKVVGKARFVPIDQDAGKYVRNVAVLSPTIVGHLFQFRPDVVFVSGFSIWTVLTLLFKWLGGWRVVIVYEGSTQTYDFQDAPLRLALRRLLVRWTDACMTNSHAGKTYLTKVLHAPATEVFAQPYEVPDPSALLQRVEGVRQPVMQRPVFLFAGQLVPRKGLNFLLDACAQLNAWGHQAYSLVVVGDGVQRQELEQMSRDRGLTNVHWAGWVPYNHLGTYFTQADVFILPSLEDTWGMVVLEAMVFGKPVLCSQWVGTAELIKPGENGEIFDPYQTETLAQYMLQFIQYPDQIARMGARSKALIAPHNPTNAVNFLIQVIGYVRHK